MHLLKSSCYHCHAVVLVENPSRIFRDRAAGNWFDLIPDLAFDSQIQKVNSLNILKRNV